MFKKIKSEYFYEFNIPENNFYTVYIEAACQSGKIIKLFGGEDLRVEIDNIRLREIPAKGRPQYFNIPSTWNGTELKGLTKTVIFILKLNKGKHTIKFISKRGATIQKEPVIKSVKTDNSLLQNIQAQNGNRRPWVTIALIDLPLNTLDISATCGKRPKDSDDLKLIIDSKTKKNKESNWWGKNWFWRGRQLQGGTKDARFYPKLDRGTHYIEFWADMMPVLNKVNLNIGQEQGCPEEQTEKVAIKVYTGKGITGDEDYNRYDNKIKEIVDDWNKIFLHDIYPVTEPLDPNLVKAIIYEESRMGYHPGGEIDVMQVGNTGDPAIKTLNGELEEYWMYKGAEILLNYESEANADTPYNSIKWGVRWLYHKAQGITHDNKRYWRSWKDAVKGYGPGTDEYVDRVWSVYTKGTDKKSNIKLWSLFLIPLLLSAASLLIYFSQGYIFLKYKDIGEEHTCIGRAWLEIGIIDGLRIKKTTVGPIDGLPWSTATGIMKDSVIINYYDFDNDGRDDVLVSAYHTTGNKVRYLYKIGQKSLEEMKFIDYSNPITGNNSFYADNIMFGTKDDRGRYTFIEESIIYYSNAPDQIWRSYYRFNDLDEIILDRLEKENIETA